jgi:hypothetical protein
MGSVDELLAGLLASERRTEELIAALLDETACEESSDDEDEAEEMGIIQDVYDKVCAMEARLCVVEARLEEVAAAELQLQLAGAVRVVVDEIGKVPMIEIEVATTAAAAAATMFERAVTEELTAAAVVWWNGCVEKVVVEKRGKYGEWMREWEAMVRWCGGGWLR